VDKDKCKRIETAVKHLGLQARTMGYGFPVSQWEKVIQTFSLLGSIKPSASYTDFLTQRGGHQL
jgi:hypothetical protein